MLDIKSYTTNTAKLFNSILFISTHSHSTMYITVQPENCGKLERVRKG